METESTTKPLSTRWRLIAVRGDAYRGFEAVTRLRWWPFWSQLKATNTHLTKKDAIEYAQRIAKIEVI